MYYNINVDYEKRIKDYFKNKQISAIQISNIKKFLNKNNDIKKYLDQILLEVPQYEKYLNLFQHILFNFELKKCKNCGKLMIWKLRKNNYCSKKCSSSSKEFINSRKLTCLKKYNSEFYYQSNDFKDKRKKSLLNNYGVKQPYQSEIVLERMKETNLKKYGVDFYSKTLKFKNDRKNTWIKKYGVKNPMLNNEIKNKRRDTNIKKYGFSNPQILKKIEKIKSWKDYVIPLFLDKDIETGYNKVYKWKCTKCGHIFYFKLSGLNKIKEINIAIPRCEKCYPYKFSHSFSENELVSFCKSYFDNIDISNRKIIKPQELDIVIHEIKLAIEFNGNFYHSINENKGVSIGYHLNKVLKCNKKGYRLIHIWEDEWDNNKDEIKGKLIKIFEGKEIIDYSKPLDRSWYNNLEGDFEELPPEIVIRNGHRVENCGYLIRK